MVAKDSYDVVGLDLQWFFQVLKGREQENTEKTKTMERISKREHTLKLNVILSSLTLSPLTWTREIGGWDNSKHSISGVTFPR